MLTIKEYDLQMLREKVDYLEKKGKTEFDKFQADKEVFTDQIADHLRKAVRLQTGNNFLKELLVKGKGTIKKLKEDAKPPKIVDADGKIADLEAQLISKNLKLRKAKKHTEEWRKKSERWREDYNGICGRYKAYCIFFRIFREEISGQRDKDRYTNYDRKDLAWDRPFNPLEGCWEPKEPKK